MKILIVDDEVIIRTGLAKVIKWKEIGLELLDPAASAEEALRRIPEERPHILLTDIRMKHMNGLDLAEKAREIIPELETIILSGYDDFVYMQQAIRQGVSDYLLKTSRPEEIMKTVLQVKQRIEDKWKHHNQDQYKNQEIRKRLFERWIIEGETTPVDAELLPFYLPQLFAGQTASGDRLQVFIITAEGWGDSPGSVSLLLFAVDNMLHELLPGETLIYKQRIVLVTCREQQAVELDAYPAAVLQKIKSLLKCRLHIAIGKTVRRREQLHDAYRAADYAFSYKTVLDQPVLMFADIAARKGGKTVCTQDEEHELSAILLEDDSVALKNWVISYVQPELDNPQTTIDSLESLVHSAALSAHRWLERAVSATGRSGMIEEQLQPFQLKADQVFLKDALFQHLLSIMELFHHRLAGGQTTHTQKAMAYIREHVGKDISLQQVAKYVHLHPNHLSEVFKKEAGLTFGDYVTRQKIERAKEILSVSPAKIAEIAGTVGFDDFKYFSQVFKKITGMTPSEFREEASRATGQPQPPKA
ncbi:response regulator [Paenibacillus thalictri]|uniref:Response regulator n=1 Tax=Paenibacillus thalictri TaxID=2527873 RepID=A0A4Q9DPM0_9BACL|nr:response regulator [Paenibacillus thalictri]TBL75740.1 response regulator [Paenibacillus thalictri]